MKAEELAENALSVARRYDGVSTIRGSNPQAKVSFYAIGVDDPEMARDLERCMEDLKTQWDKADFVHPLERSPWAWKDAAVEPPPRNRTLVLRSHPQCESAAFLTLGQVEGENAPLPITFEGQVLSYSTSYLWLALPEDA